MGSARASLLVGCCIAFSHQISVAAAVRDCTLITSSVERLACFDQAAGTPIQLPVVQAQPFKERLPDIIALMQRNEAKRLPGEQRFLMSVSPELGDERQQRAVISAPALGWTAHGFHLAISCESKITRLQLVADQPLVPNKVQLRLLKDGRPVSEAYPWRVLDSGVVIDAGRGLQAIALLRGLYGGHRLQLESDYAPLDGLAFDIEGLGDLIDRERQICRW